MAGTINAANITIGLDIAKLQSGMNATRGQINQLRGILREARDPAEELTAKMDLLRKAFDAGAIDANSYARALDHLSGKMDKLKSNKVGEFMSGKLKGAIAGAAGAFTVSSLFGQIKDIDDTADAAAKVGLSYRELIVLQRTLGESAAVSAEQVTGGMGKMMVNLANARDKGGELDASLKQLGLSSRQLASMDAVTAFTTIQQKFSQISGQADKMQFAMQLFGKAGIEMVPALEVGADKFAEMEQHLERSGALLTQMQAEQMGALVDKVERFGDAWKGFAASAAPVMERIVANSARWLDNWQTFFEAFGPNAIADMSAEDRKRWEDQQAIANVERIRAERKKAEEAEIEAKMQATLARMDALKERLHKDNLERERTEAKEREKALADQEKQWAAMDKAIQDEKRKAVENELRGLQSQADRLGSQKFGENNSSIAPAIKAGTVEAYKFMNKQNDDAKAREEARRQREDIIDQIRALNTKNFAVLAKAR